MASAIAVRSARSDLAGRALSELGASPADGRVTRWLKRWVFLVVCVLTVVTVVTPFLEDMPGSHRLAVPLAAAVGLAAWTIDLAIGASWSRRLLVALVVLGNLWLTTLGHISNNYLLLSLLVAWIGVSGSRAEGAVALMLALGTFAFSSLIGATGPGQIAWAALTSWSAGAVGLWLMAVLFVRQGRIVSELHRLALENAALADQARQAAILEERQRLARELHDSVTQSLYGISLQAEAGARALTDGDAQPAGESFQEIRQTTQEAQAEMRLLLFELRPPLLEEQGFAAALEARLRAVEARAGLAIRSDVQAGAELSPEAEQELYRIAQEALNNVLKHAHASQVTVRLALDADRASLEILDDGIGFDGSAAKTGGHGLEGMRERAEHLGGSLSIESSPERGTRVRVEVPR